MRRLLSASRTPAVLVGALAALLAGGGYAFASRGGAIHACVRKGSHLLYTDRCKKGDKKLSWNRAGRRGPRGATGSEGAPGPEGPPGPQGVPGLEGPSSGYSTYQQRAVGIPIPNDNLGHTVASLTIPAGSYMVIAKTTVQNANSGEALDTCDLIAPGGSSNNAAIDESTSSTGSNEFATLSLVGPLTTGGGTLSLRCVSGLNNTEAYDTHLTAIKLGSVTGT
jgi:hypothetical protein